MKTSKADIAARLAEVALFSRCSQRDLRTIARHVEVVRVREGKTVVEQGAKGDAFFIILSGTVDVVRDRAVAATLGDGDHFGELALLDPGLRSATVVTRSEVDLGVLTVRMFRVLLRDMPHIAERLLASLASQLRDARN